MAKDKLTDYDSTAANNLDVGGISVAEGMLPSAVNNAIRELMSHQAEAFGAGTPLYVDQTNNRLGIGNAAPTVPLDVTGAAVVSGDLTVDTSTLKVDSTNNRVGIVNASPTTALDVTGDITVSGGVYLGGTGAANYLNDYEEGTWTPTYEAQVTAFTSVTYDPATYGKYVKVGDLVHIQGLIKTDALSGGSGAVLIGGLPFTSSSVTAVSVGYTNAFSGDYPSGGSLLGASTTVSLLYRTSANGALNNALDVTDLGTGGNDNYIEFSCTYRI